MFDLTQFRATRRQPTPEEYAECVSAGLPSHVEASKVHVYADGYAIHEEDGKFWVHAWWYAPRPYDTLEEAEEELYPWYLEFV